MSRRKKHTFNSGDIVNHLDVSDWPMIVQGPYMYNGEHHNNEYNCQFLNGNMGPDIMAIEGWELILDTRYNRKTKNFKSNIYNFSRHPDLQDLRCLHIESLQ